MVTFLEIPREFATLPSLADQKGRAEPLKLSFAFFIYRKFIRLFQCT